MKKNGNIMFSPDLFQEDTRTNVFSNENGAWVGYILKRGDNEFYAVRINGQAVTVETEDTAKLFLRNSRIPAQFIQSVNPDAIPEPINPSQTNLFT